MTQSNDPFDLNRFVEAQEPVIDRVRAELRAGRKQSHWMWFIFPQIAGLGSSPMSVKYAISGLDEAHAYLDHAALGPRLIECTKLVAVSGRSVSEIFGWPDDMKFKSSMTLFARAGEEAGVFAHAIDRHFAGEMDAQTLAKL